MSFDFLSQVYLGNSVLDYFMVVAVFVVACLALFVFKALILKTLKKWAEKTATTIDDFLIEIIKKLLVPLAYCGAFYISINTLELDPILKKVIASLAVAVITFMTAKFMSLLVAYAFKVYSSKGDKNLALERSLSGILRIARFLIWALALMFFLDNVGFKISTVIAGLGIGGIAVAMAAQAVLKDLFSYFSILFDRPFEVGDFIIVNDYLGVVENIGVKTTRIRSLGGEQLIFSNTDLTDSRVRNYKRMQKRRVVFKLGVTYNTPLEKLKAMPGIIKNAITSIKDTAFDRAHFASYGDFSLNYEVVYYVLAADYNKYMDIQQEINFAIKGEFEKHAIDFAYPTQTLHVNKS